MVLLCHIAIFHHLSGTATTLPSPTVQQWDLVPCQAFLQTSPTQIRTTTVHSYIIKMTHGTIMHWLDKLAISDITVLTILVCQVLQVHPGLLHNTGLYYYNQVSDLQLGSGQLLRVPAWKNQRLGVLQGTMIQLAWTRTMVHMVQWHLCQVRYATHH